jgi:hypothetical protein
VELEETEVEIVNVSEEDTTKEDESEGEVLNEEAIEEILLEHRNANGGRISKQTRGKISAINDER